MSPSTATALSSAAPFTSLTVARGKEWSEGDDCLSSQAADRTRRWLLEDLEKKEAKVHTFVYSFMFTCIMDDI